MLPNVAQLFACVTHGHRTFPSPPKAKAAPTLPRFDREAHAAQPQIQIPAQQDLPILLAQERHGAECGEQANCSALADAPSVGSALLTLPRAKAGAHARAGMSLSSPSGRQLAFLAARALDRDVVVRAFTPHLRLSYVQATVAANEAAQRHRVRDTATAVHVGDLLTASCLLSSFLEGQERAMLTLNLDQPAGHPGLRAIAVESMRAGQVRAAVSGGPLIRHLSSWEQEEELAAAATSSAAAHAIAAASAASSGLPLPDGTAAGACAFGSKPTLTGTRALYGGHQYAVSVVSASADGVPTAFDTFLRQSEQRDSVALIETVVSNGSLDDAGADSDVDASAGASVRVVSSLGFMAQLLPGGDAAALDDARAAVAEGGGVLEAMAAKHGAGGSGLADALRRAVTGDVGVTGFDSAVFMGGASIGRWADAVSRGRAATDPASALFTDATATAPAAAPAAGTETIQGSPAAAGQKPATGIVGRAGPLTATGRFGARVLPQALLMRAAGIDHDGQVDRSGAAGGDDEAGSSSEGEPAAEGDGPMTAPLDAGVSGWWSKEAFSVIPLHFFCNCSLKGFQRRVAGLPQAELESMMADVQSGSAAGPGGSCHLVKCHWCASEYELDEPALEEVMAMQGDRERT